MSGEIPWNGRRMPRLSRTRDCSPRSCATGQDPRWPSPDLTHGRAGLGLTLRELWRHSGGQRLPARARTVADLPPSLADASRLGDFLSLPYAWAAFTCHGIQA
jgi:hypothetical protein